MSLFGNPAADAIRKLDADPKLVGWPMWSTRTGRRYVIVPERVFRDLADRAGYEITKDGFRS